MTASRSSFLSASRSLAGLGFLLCISLAHFPVSAIITSVKLTPISDHEVLEKVAPRKPLAQQTTDTTAIASQVREAINLAREKSDPRYFGRAQALLGQHWNNPTAAPELMVLQATIEQSRHEFETAKMTLKVALKRQPNNAQGWLTLATLERIAGNYRQALNACHQVHQSGASFYAQACELETRSLFENDTGLTKGFQKLITQSQSAEQKSWVYSLLAEHFARSNQFNEANKIFQISLSKSSDSYTAIAAADLLLSQAQPQQALQVLANQVDSDSVLIRRAYALKLLNDNQWKTLRKVIASRFADTGQRGDDVAAHAREQALAALWLEQDPKKALQQATINLARQKESIDWWLSLSSAKRAKDKEAFKTTQAELKRIGLKDKRLNVSYE